MMNPNAIEGYLEQIYGYAVNHTYSREEADDLSQEILFTLVRKLPRLRDEDRFEPWLWGVASNVTKSFRRSMGKQRAMYSYDCLELESLSYEDEQVDANEELYASLRAKIATLSAIYRDIIILYYYDGLSISQISEKLNISEGTIMWRLSEARKKIKKECENMDETALRHVKLNLGINGCGMYDYYINACEDILCNGSSEDIDSVANAIKDGYIVRRADGSFFVTTPAFTKAQKNEFNGVAEKYLAPLMPEYSEIVRRFTADFKKLIPRHLSDDADRMCRNMSMGLYTAVIEYAQETGRIQMPSQGCFCDVMLQSK